MADTKDDEIAALNEQVRQLVAENQPLRLQLAQKTESAQTQQHAAPAAGARFQSSRAMQTAVQPRAQEYWMTISSGKRHNSSCRYYKNSKGRPCTKDEVIPCKICGG